MRQGERRARDVPSDGSGAPGSVSSALSDVSSALREVSSLARGGSLACDSERFIFGLFSVPLDSASISSSAVSIALGEEARARDSESIALPPEIWRLLAESPPMISPLQP